MESFTSSKIQVSLRIISVGLFVSTACMVGSDKQTKKLFSAFEREATFKDIKALLVLTVVDSLAAGYNILQVIKHFICDGSKRNITGFGGKGAWISFLLDQVFAYGTFSVNSAAMQGSILAITGASSFQWLKLCNIYTKFCIQMGGGLVCGLLASLAMAAVSSFDAYNVFRFYSAKEFLVLKRK